MTKNAEDRDLDTINEDYEEPTEDHETDSYGKETGEEEQEPEEDASDDRRDDAGDDEGDDRNDFRDRLNRAHRQIERLKEENVRLKEGGPRNKESGKEVGDSTHVEKALLAAYGFKDRDDQILIKDMARKAGVGIEEALDDDFIMARFEHMKKKQQVREASARPNGKGVTTKRDAGYYADKGLMPKDREMAAKVRAELARRARDENA